MPRDRKSRKQHRTPRASQSAEPKTASARHERREKALEASRARNRELMLLISVLAISAFAYVNALDGQFVYDDRLQVLKNPTLNSLANIPKVFVQGVWQFLNEGDKTAVGPYYRPLFNVALIINYRLFGFDVFGWHLVSIALHLLVVYLVYRLARQWGLSFEVAVAAALLFGLHPVHSESVAWVAALPDPLAAVFLLSSLILYERYFRGRTSPTFVLVASVALALLAMLSKEVAVIFPVFLAVREVLDKQQIAKLSELIARIARRVWPFVAAVGVYLGMRYLVLGFLRHDEQKSLGIPAFQVLLTIPSVLISYARMLLIPFPLSVMYDNKYVTSAADPRFCGAALALIAMFVLSCWLVRKSPTGRLALAFLIVFILPVLNLKAFRQEESLLHDRYLYLPSVGFCILIAMAIDWISARFAERRRQVFGAAIAVSAVLLLGLTYLQNFSWQNELALTENAMKVVPRWPFLH